ncbi:MAG: chemotaxis protein CheC [Bacteroidia bacterium]
MPEVSEVELDITRELINIGLAKVADSLAAIAKETVLVNVPDIKLLRPENLDKILPVSNPQDIVIQSDIVGDITGQTFLIFTQKQIENIAKVCIGCKEDFTGNYGAMEKSLLLEISNMLTGALVTQLADILQFTLHGLPPQFVPYRDRNTFHELIKNLNTCRPFVFTVKTEFKNTGNIAEMPLLVVFDADTFEKVITAIREKNEKNTGKLFAK